MGKPDVQALHRAVALRSYDPRTYEFVCRTLCAGGEHAYAEGIFARWLHVDPDNGRARHLRAALLGKEVPDRCSEMYLRQEFDGFANSYDSVLEELRFRAPELVLRAVLDDLPRGTGLAEVLDAGCGTGLCGKLIRPHARHLTGVDVAGGMLLKAHERGVYDELFQAELTTFLRTRSAAFDVVASSDALIYFGVLGPLFEAVASALRPGGCVVATLERCDVAAADGYRLNATGRYSHTDAYVKQVAVSSGLTLRAMATEIIRTEGGEPVMGLVFRADRAVFSAA